MATNTDTHVSRVILDTKEAKDKLNELQNKLKEVQKPETRLMQRASQQQPSNDR